MPSANPTARALRALDAISSRPGITATELGAALDVTERAARRYVQTLRDADIPIESVRGPYGGYRLGRGLRLPPLVFSDTEALGLDYIPMPKSVVDSVEAMWSKEIKGANGKPLI